MAERSLDKMTHCSYVVFGDEKLKTVWMLNISITWLCVCVFFLGCFGFIESV